MGGPNGWKKGPALRSRARGIADRFPRSNQPADKVPDLLNIRIQHLARRGQHGTFLQLRQQPS